MSCLGKTRVEMCWFYMGIAQIALDPPPSVKRANVEKKCPKPTWQAPFTPSALQAMPIWKQQISKRGFPYQRHQVYQEHQANQV